MLSYGGSILGWTRCGSGAWSGCSAFGAGLPGGARAAGGCCAKGDAARLAIDMRDPAHSKQEIADRLANLSLPDAD